MDSWETVKAGLATNNDHAATQTFDKRPGNATQRALANGSKQGYLNAVRKDVLDVKRIAAESGDPTKYDFAITMMMDYVRCLIKEGKIK
ncbi:MAG: hypothetical protein ACRBCL_08205 [Maritimibacter sp.]